ncbi:SDR family NAD(P)-dependent oxidoreductase [Steroidobacter cummioxidans]|uniref:SDR family NAD(P)-dependent oxidoreductase n=1 Tax=Steroidobacter cummioxidans TaxID=1803913 RepID=UPI000E3184F0|nr:SDR family NAD(P)-dependent oxidoreductase [Steroidobacter cummioxidans]
MSKPLCVITGVGEGNGAALARAFSKTGMAVALLARGTQFATKLAASLPDARAYACDVSDADAVARTFSQIRSELGDPVTLVHNAGSGVWGDVESIDLQAFESAWRVNAYGALAVSREVIPAMKAAGSGNIIFIGATASRRGGPQTAAFAPAKAAQRSLAESMARSLWPQGIHVSLIVIDAVVDIPRTRAAMPGKPDGFFLQPDAMAASAVWLAQQPRSAWTFEIEVRPFGEKW